jgi:CrcB protein
MQQWLLVALGGALGSMLRFAAQRFIPAQFFPYGTFAVNITGCLLIGVLWAFVQKQALPFEGRLLLISGFCGGFTTFSAFTLESMVLLQSGRWALFFIYVLLSVALGLLATFIGFKLFN